MGGVGGGEVNRAMSALTEAVYKLMSILILVLLTMSCHQRYMSVLHAFHIITFWQTAYNL